MADFRKSKWLLIAFILFFIVQSCAGMKNWLLPQRSVHASAHDKHSSQVSGHAPDQAKHPSQVSVQGPAQVVIPARQYMDAGEYQNAIDDYNAEYRSHPQDRALVKEYVKSLEDIKAVADKASDKEDFAFAGRIYNVLLKNYSHFKGFVQMLSFDRAHLNKKLSHCKKSLSTQGFQEYRKGNLSEAIVLWQSLITIDPNNADIKAAVRTATLQQKNLQEKN
jgi:tetratricopeptide (TPR) repeat protein